MSVILDLDEQALASLPLGPGERERHMQIERICRFYASGWLTLDMSARMAGLDHFAFGVALTERGIPPAIRTHRGPGRPRPFQTSLLLIGLNFSSGDMESCAFRSRSRMNWVNRSASSINLIVIKIVTG